MTRKKMISRTDWMLYSGGMRKLALVLLIGLAAAPSRADSITITPDADAGIMSKFPDNNLGASVDMPVGGVANGSLPCRGLLRFPLTGIPAGAVITNVTLAITVTKVPSGEQGTALTLNRLLRSWGEGKKSGQTGASASAGEVTWKNTGSGTWTAPGGAAGTDFATDPSSSVSVSTSAKYTFPSTAQLVADVQAWLNDTNSNFGWMMKADRETTARTAKRVGSRQASTANRPILKVGFTPPPPPPTLTITMQNQVAHLSWTGGTPGYQVQRKLSLSDSNWENVSPVLTTTSADIPAGDATAFYRLVSGL